MFQRLLVKIDGLSDRFHPIVILCLRRQRQGQRHLSFLVLFFPILIFILFFGDFAAAHFGSFWSTMGEIYLPLICLLPAFVCFGTATNGYFVLAKADPLFVETALPRRSLWIGFYQAAVLYGFFSFCNVTLIYSFLYLLRWVPLEYVYLYPALAYLGGLVVAGMGASLSIAAKTRLHRIILLPFYFLPIWIAMMVAISPPFRSIFVDLVNVHLSPKLLTAPALPIFYGIALFLYGLSARRLFEFNAVPGRSFVRKFLVSITVYAAVSLLLALLVFLAIRYL